MTRILQGFSRWVTTTIHQSLRQCIYISLHRRFPPPFPAVIAQTLVRTVFLHPSRLPPCILCSNWHPKGALLIFIQFRHMSHWSRNSRSKYVGITFYAILHDTSPNPKGDAMLGSSLTFLSTHFGFCCKNKRAEVEWLQWSSTNLIGSNNINIHPSCRLVLMPGLHDVPD